MPKSMLDWLAVVSLWVGAVVEAIKAGDLPLMSGAPAWLASHVWGYVPIILITFYMLVQFYRLAAPAVTREQPERPGVGKQPSASPAPSAALADRREARRVIADLRNAQFSAGIALSKRDARMVSEQVPTMKAALLSAHKKFGTPEIPAQVANPNAYLGMSRNMIEKMLPFLEADHIPEARAEAEAYLEKVGPKAS